MNETEKKPRRCPCDSNGWFDTSPAWHDMSIREKLRKQVDIRGTSSPFGAMAKDALAEILRLETLLEIANGEPHH